MKKALKVIGLTIGIIVVIFVAAYLTFGLILTTQSSKKPKSNFDMFPFFVLDSDAALTAERSIVIEDFRAERPRIMDIYTIHNSGNAMDVLLIYPQCGDLMTIEVDGVALDKNDMTRLKRDKQDGTYYAELKDGTYFHQELPIWRRGGEPVYDVISVSIPANGQIVTKFIYSDLEDVSTLNIKHLHEEIPLTRQSVTVEATQYIAEQNLADDMPEAGEWSIDLDPSRKNLHIRFFE